MNTDTQWLTTSQIAEMVPSRIRGRNVSSQTVRRWQLFGLRGIYLQSVLIGGARCSSKEHVDQFIKDLTECDVNRRFHPSDITSSKVQAPVRKRKKQEAAEKAARELGL